MLDIHNFYVVLSNSQKDRCKVKEGVKKCSRSCKQLIHIYQLNIYDITVWWSIKQIQLSEKEKSNPKKFDRMIQAIRSSKSVPGYSTILWEVKYSSKKQRFIQTMDEMYRIPKNNNGKRIHQYSGFYSIGLKMAISGILVCISKQNVMFLNSKKKR